MVVLAFTVQSTSVQTPPSAKKITDQITATRSDTQDHTCHLMLVDLNMQSRKKHKARLGRPNRPPKPKKAIHGLVGLLVVTTSAHTTGHKMIRMQPKFWRWNTGTNSMNL